MVENRVGASAENKASGWVTQRFFFYRVFFAFRVMLLILGVLKFLFRDVRGPLDSKDE